MTGEYLLGVLGLAAVAISTGVAGRTLRRALLPGWSGAPAQLATAVLAIGLVVAISQLLGLFGLLDGVLLVAACLIVGAGALRIEPLLPGATPTGLARTRLAGERMDEGVRGVPPETRLELWIALAVAALVALQWAGPTLLALDRGIYGGDTLWYHLPFAAHIAQSGSVTELLLTDPLYLNWLYPQNAELLHADGILLFGSDFLSPLLNLGWLGLAFAAGWCIGRPYGASAPALAAVAALMSANLLFSRQPGNANNDVVAIALLLAAVAVLVNSRRATATGPVIVAGLAAGLALGTKLTLVPPVGALTLGVIAIAAAGERMRVTIAWSGAVLIGGGFWYLRDLVITGSPLPFIDIGPLTKPEELAGREPFSIAHYLTDTDVWGRYFTPGLEERLGDVWPLVLVLAVAGAAIWFWRGGRLERMLAAVAVLSAIAYLVTPLGASGPEGMPVGFRLNIRYLAPALALALALAAIMPIRALLGGADGRRDGGLPAAAPLDRGIALAVFGGLTAANLIIFDPIEGERLPGAIVLALAVVGLPAAVVMLSRRGLGRVSLAAGVAAAVIAVAVLGQVAQEDYLELRYSSAAPEYPRDEYPSDELGQGLGGAFDIARGLHDERIGVSGTLGGLFQYGLWGNDSSNRVRYIGQRGDRASFQEIQECPEWIAAVNAGDLDYLVTTPAYQQDNPKALTAPIENRWLQGAPSARRVDGTGLVDVWEMRGPLDPRTCAGAGPRGVVPGSASAD